MARGGTVPSTEAARLTQVPKSNGAGHERVGRIQRTRLLMAMAEVACERGAGDVAVGHVVERAGVSRRTFYEFFADREDCFLAALDEALARAGMYVADGFDPEVVWAARIRSGLEALLGFVKYETVWARLVVVESLGGGVRALELRNTAADRLVAVVDAGRESMNRSSTATVLTAEGVVGGAAAVIHGRLVSGESERLAELINPLMSMIVLPYLGDAAARKELVRPVGGLRASVLAPGNPLKGLDIRLTYRTVRVLAAVAANPGSSNRSIGDASGMGDRGQTSKLLARLEGLGLVQNTRAEPAKGLTNSWVLTARGEEVANVIAAQPA